MSPETRRLAIAGWASLGVAAVLAESALRLTLFALPHLRGGLTPAEWGGFAATASLLGYFEGYRGFARSFCPRVVERAFDLARAPTIAYVVVAPLHAMSLVGDERRRVVRAWALVAMIVAMIVGVRELSTTWRAIVDAAVALSLAWGLLSLLTLFVGRVCRELASPSPSSGGAVPPGLSELRRSRGGLEI